MGNPREEKSSIATTNSKKPGPKEMQPNERSPSTVLNQANK